MKRNKEISFSIDKKLISLVMIVSIVTISTSAYLSFNSATEVLQERMNDRLLSESTIRGNSVLSFIHTRIKETQVISADPMIRSLVSELNGVHYDPAIYYSTIQDKRRDFLTQIQAFQELVGFSIGFEDVKIIGEEGRVFFSLVKLKTTDNFSNDPKFLRALQEPFAIFEPSEEGGSKLIVGTPIYGQEKNTKPIGVIIATMRTDEFNNILLHRSGLGETGEVYLVNQDHLMITESRFIENAPFNQIVDTLPVRECFENGKEMSGIYTDYRSNTVFGVSYCVPDLGFVLLAEFDEDETLQPVSVLQNRIFLTGLAITIVMAIVAFFLAKLLSRPITKLKDATNQITSGNYNVRTNIRTRDELGQLATSFDIMAKKLQESLITIKQKEDVIKQQEDILLNFSDQSENGCVCLIDIKDSTRITAKMSDSQAGTLYSTFLNSMATIVQKFKGTVIKNIGDALLFYFPKTNPHDIQSFKNVLDCCFEMIDAHDKICNMLEEKGLPCVDYKISATYGSVRLASTTTSDVTDIFGSTVNQCAKINGLAPKNGLIVGESVFNVVKSLEQYSFSKMDKQMPDYEQEYVVYIVSRK
ncbi:MAG TPA: cache domain-containing protein [Nitrosopumilaceae archaeon]|jgi:class 3 adenylate cyclase